MPRSLVSLLATILVVAGAVIGWSSGEDIAGVAGARAREVGDAVSPGDAPASSRTSSARSTTSGGASRDPGRSPSSTTTPRPTYSTTTSEPGIDCSRPAPTDAAGMNVLFSGLDRQPRLQGADHGGSVRLADGRRMFVYGDTIRDLDVVSPFMVRNAVAVTTQGCIQVMETPDDGPAIPARSSSVGYWPMSLRATPTSSGTRVEVLTTRVLRTGRGLFDTVGPGLAVFDVPTNRMPRLVSRTDIGPDRRDPTYPTWGAAMWDAGEHVYLFGTASNADKSTFGWSLHVARTSAASLTDPSAWEYWDGTRWVRGDPSAATTKGGTLIPAEHGVSHVLSVFQRDDSWYALSKEGDFIGTRLAVWRAPSVTGPWVKHDLGPLANDSSVRRYTPLAHPDLATSSGRLLVSYSQSPLSSSTYRTHPELYRPQFIEVSLP